MRAQTKKFISTALCAGALLGVLCLPALAAGTDFNYSGSVDPETGLPSYMGSDSREQSLIFLSDSMYYDRDLHCYVYPLGTGISEVYVDVADGMIVNEPVSISASDGTSVQVYRDGTALGEVDLTRLTTPGSYNVSAKSGDSTVQLLTFTIVGERTNLAGGYTMPDGFYITDATLEGEEIEYDRTYLPMDQEGQYHIEYSCPATGLSYVLDVFMDRTPPQLTFDANADKQGRSRSAVTVGGFQPGDTVALTLNGERVSFPNDGVLKPSGNYALEVTDAAGNSATYQFTILVYFDSNSLIFFSLVVLSIAAVAVYIVIKRKNLKIF